jgi:hypothetical protein
MTRIKTGKKIDKLNQELTTVIEKIDQSNFKGIDRSELDTLGNFLSDLPCQKSSVLLRYL